MSSASTKLHTLPTSTVSRPHKPTTTTASSRTLSPSFSAFAVARGMPSPRTSPAMRPTSPLPPGYKTSGHFDALQPTQQRPPFTRSTSSHHQQRQNRSLRLPTLPSLPRFHPANFPSTTTPNSSNSVQTTPDGTTTTTTTLSSCYAPPPPPMSPRAYQRLYNDAQKQLYFNQQREMFSPATPGRPASPRLAPLGSPGPVTPLELERDEGYLVAGAQHLHQQHHLHLHHPAATPSDVADKMVAAEVARQTA